MKKEEMPIGMEIPCGKCGDTMHWDGERWLHSDGERKCVNRRGK